MKIGDDLPPGFALVRKWAAHLDALTVESALEWSQRTVRVFGGQFQMPRLTTYYGSMPYTYSGGRHEARPMPLVLEELVDRLALTVGSFNTCLGNLYRDGRDSIAWHADDEPELGAMPTIASVSLGAARAFLVRRCDDRQAPRWSVELRHGDLLVMSGRSQLDYEHSVPKRAAGVRRINLTFRAVQ